MKGGFGCLSVIFALLANNNANFFRDDISLLPLKPIIDTDSGGNTNDNHRSKKFSNITVPVLYTNDKFVAKEWIEEHVCHRPMIVGWDTEVR